LSKSDDHPRLIIAALLWNTPTLLGADNPSARAFFDALAEGFLRNESDLPEDDPLANASRALVAALEGRLEEARQALSRISVTELWTRLLRNFLAAWLLEDNAPNVFPTLADDVREVRDNRVRAHLLAKIATLALDVGEREQAQAYLREARTSVAGNTPLGFQLQLAEANLFGTIPQVLSPPREIDPLVEYSWIQGRALGSARRALAELVESRVASPWSSTLRFGLTSAEQSVLAEMQATWAGALWLRSDLKTLASSLLLLARASASDVAYGIALWILGSGKNIPQIIDDAERSFEPGTADSLYRYLRGFGEYVGEAQRFAEVVSATWDLVSEDLAAGLLDRLPIRVGEHLTLDPSVLVRTSVARATSLGISVLQT